MGHVAGYTIINDVSARDRVGVGRPTLYSLALGGWRGVHAMVEALKYEFALAMKLSGVAKVSNIGPDLIEPRSPLRVSESKLDVRLADRSARRFRLTDESLLLYSRGRAILDQVRDAEAEVASRGRDVSRRLANQSICEADIYPPCSQILHRSLRALAPPHPLRRQSRE